jgi:hypothetical protein
MVGTLCPLWSKGIKEAHSQISTDIKWSKGIKEAHSQISTDIKWDVLWLWAEFVNRNKNILTFKWPNCYNETFSFTNSSWTRRDVNSTYVKAIQPWPHGERSAFNNEITALWSTGICEVYFFGFVWFKQFHAHKLPLSWHKAFHKIPTQKCTEPIKQTTFLYGPIQYRWKLCILPSRRTVANGDSIIIGYYLEPGFDTRQVGRGSSGRVRYLPVGVVGLKYKRNVCCNVENGKDM